MEKIDNSEDFLARAIDTSNGFNDCKPEELQNFLTQPYEKLKEKNPETNETIEDFTKSFVKSFNNICKPFRTILLLSANQFTLTESLSPRSIIRSIRANQLNQLDEYLLNQSDAGKEFDIYKILESITNSQHATKYKKNVQECIHAFNNELYYPSAVGIIAIADGIISNISNDQKPNFTTRIDKIQKAALRTLKSINTERKSNDIDFLNQNIAFISFFASQYFFFGRAPFTNSEPLHINRHWIAHGRSSRCVSKLDCIKLFRLLNTLLTINELLSTE